MKAQDLHLQNLLKFDPVKGQVSFGKQRVVIMSTEIIGQLTQEIIEIGDFTAARVILRRVGEVAGRELARQFNEEFHPANKIDWLGFGPAMHAWEGVAHPELAGFEYVPEAGKFFLHVQMTNSYLAEQYLKHSGSAAPEPICWLLAGHISGYCSEVFEMDLLCKEVKCAAMGDPFCEFITKPRADWL